MDLQTHPQARCRRRSWPRSTLDAAWRRYRGRRVVWKTRPASKSGWPEQYPQVFDLPAHARRYAWVRKSAGSCPSRFNARADDARTLTDGGRADATLPIAHIRPAAEVMHPPFPRESRPEFPLRVARHCRQGAAWGTVHIAKDTELLRRVRAEAIESRGPTRISARAATAASCARCRSPAQTGSSEHRAGVCLPGSSRPAAHPAYTMMKFVEGKNLSCLAE